MKNFPKIRVGQLYRFLNEKDHRSLKITEIIVEYDFIDKAYDCYVGYAIFSEKTDEQPETLLCEDKVRLMYFSQNIVKDKVIEALL